MEARFGAGYEVHEGKHNHLAAPFQLVLLLLLDELGHPVSALPGGSAQALRSDLHVLMLLVVGAGHGIRGHLVEYPGGTEEADQLFLARHR